jgi:hypothetical protein
LALGFVFDRIVFVAGPIASHPCRRSSREQPPQPIEASRSAPADDWTRVRDRGAQIPGTDGASQEVMPFLMVANDTDMAVNQGGKRKGAVCAYPETWHIDIEALLDRRRTPVRPAGTDCPYAKGPGIAPGPLYWKPGPAAQHSVVFFVLVSPNSSVFVLVSVLQPTDPVDSTVVEVEVETLGSVFFSIVVVLPRMPCSFLMVVVVSCAKDAVLKAAATRMKASFFMVQLRDQDLQIERHHCCLGSRWPSLRKAKLARRSSFPGPVYRMSVRTTETMFIMARIASRVEITGTRGRSGRVLSWN